jgi:hypothetical protein
VHAAFQKFDESHSHKLSHARLRGSSPRKADSAGWAKEQSNSTYKLLMWVWKLRGRSEKSNDPDIKALKALLPSKRALLRPPVATSGGKPKDKGAKVSVAGKTLDPSNKGMAETMLQEPIVCDAIMCLPALAR